MILQSQKILGASVMSLQTSSEIAKIDRAIVDPADLSIIAFEVKGPMLPHTANLLRLADVRELSDLGFIIDSADEFVAPEDVLAVAEIYNLHFDLPGMKVLDEKRRKLGKITSFTVDSNDFTVQQLSVKRPLLQSLNDTELLIHRSQITEINDDAIIVHSKAEIPEPTLDSIRQSYVNPFRKAGPAPEAIDQK